jgi:hypothetical protein
VVGRTEAHDYPAAGPYLSLIYASPAPKRYVEHLRQAPISQYKAKDIFPSVGASPSGRQQFPVEEAVTIPCRPSVIYAHACASVCAQRVIMAGGYHRLCAVYSFDADYCSLQDRLALKARASEVFASLA